MVISSTRFGDIEVDENKIIFFEKGIPGIENLKKYIFITPKDSYPLYFLQSIENMNIALPVVNPFDVKSNYNPKVTDEDFKELCIENDEDLLVLNVCVAPNDIKKITVNLSAPILINIKRFIAKQIILDDKEYSIREPIYDSFINLLKGGASDASVVAQEG